MQFAISYRHLLFKPIGQHIRPIRSLDCHYGRQTTCIRNATSFFAKIYNRCVPPPSAQVSYSASEVSDNYRTLVIEGDKICQILFNNASFNCASIPDRSLFYSCIIKSNSTGFTEVCNTSIDLFIHHNPTRVIGTTLLLVSYLLRFDTYLLVS
jgi:hypothetical protein